MGIKIVIGTFVSNRGSDRAISTIENCLKMKLTYLVVHNNFIVVRMGMYMYFQDLNRHTIQWFWSARIIGIFRARFNVNNTHFWSNKTECKLLGDSFRSKRT